MKTLFVTMIFFTLFSVNSAFAISKCIVHHESANQIKLTFEESEAAKVELSSITFSYDGTAEDLLKQLQYRHDTGLCESYSFPK